MTIATLEDLTALPVGTKVVIGGSEDPYTKVDENFFEYDENKTRVRVSHFVGAATAGQLAKYDTTAPRRWAVRKGTGWYSLILGPGPEEGQWKCLTFKVTNPKEPYHSGPKMVVTRQLGTTLIEPDQVPWADFAQAMAVHIETITESFGVQIEAVRKDQEALTQRKQELMTEVRKADTLRRAMKDFIG